MAGEDDKRDHENRMVLVVAAGIVAAGVMLLLLYRHWQAESDCLLAGHHNCAPIDTNTTQ